MITMRNKCLLEAVFGSLKTYKYELNNDTVVVFTEQFYEHLDPDDPLRHELSSGEELYSDAIHKLIPFICKRYDIHLNIKLFYKEQGFIDPEDFVCTCCDTPKRNVILDFANNHWSAHPTLIEPWGIYEQPP
jgi:hypothetical protein